MRFTSLIPLCLALTLSCARAPSVPGVTSPTGSPSSKPSLKHEGWESSGGGGVACFKTAADAKEASEALTKHGSLTQALREKTASVVTLDYWEQALHYREFAHKQRTEITAELASRLEKYSPIFFSRWQLVQRHIDFRQWLENEALPRIEDATPKIKVQETDPKCRVVQLAVRYTRSKKGFLPEADVEVDKWLFENRLDPINQAMLLFHEELYLMARELLHKNSDAVRRVVALLFSDEISAEIAQAEKSDAELRANHTPFKSTTYPANSVQMPINYILGDYYLYFNSDPLDQPKVIPTATGQYSRYRSFGSLLIKLRARKGQCLEERKYDTLDQAGQAAAQEECSFLAVDTRTLSPLISDEEAFVFAARWVLDRLRLIQNSENLVVWNREAPSAISPLQKDELSHACGAVKTLNLPYFANIIKKAARYCQTLP